MRNGKTESDYIAENYDELVDSPIVAGNVIKYPFEVAGIPHYLVNVEQSGNWDAEKATADLAKMVAEHERLWGELPYDRYYFLNVFTAGGGGLEHNNCCLLMTGQFDVRNEGSYKRWLGLCSHEFFHAWNIRRLRPNSLVKYDYENEVYTPSLWIAEGITSYYEDLLLARAGLITQEDFISSFGNTIAAVQRTEGRLVQSLRDSSHDAWIKFYRPAGNSSDTQISYYTKGAVVGFLLDSEIRSASGGAKSLDDVLRELWKQCRETGYTPEDFRRLCNEAAGKDLEDWFRVAVDSSEELDYQVAANWYGLDIGDVKPQTGDEAEDSEETQTSSRSSRTLRGRPWIGIGEFDSPATNAGLADTDEVIAINSRRVSGNLDTELQDFKVGDPIKVLIARNGELQEILLVVGSRPARPSWNLKVTRRPTDEQKAHLDAWFGIVQVEEAVVEESADENAAEPPADEAKPDEGSKEMEAAGDETSEGGSAPVVETNPAEAPETAEAADQSTAVESGDDASGSADGESSTGEGEGNGGGNAAAA
jgi:predicted metalloprotease with PDZ domain